MGGVGSEYDFVFLGIYCDSFLPITVSYVDKNPTLDSDHFRLVILGLLLDENWFFLINLSPQKVTSANWWWPNSALASYPSQMEAKNFKQYIVIKVKFMINSNNNIASTITIKIKKNKKKSWFQLKFYAVDSK